MNTKNISNAQTLRLIDIEAEEQELHQMISEAISRLKQLGEERLKILTEAKSDIPTLAFDRDGRTIRWETGQISLGPKAFRFVKSLWFAKKWRLRTGVLCQKVFESSTTSDETFRKFLRRLSQKLRIAYFPYRIVPVKNDLTREIQGYRLRGTS